MRTICNLQLVAVLATLILISTNTFGQLTGCYSELYGQRTTGEDVYRIFVSLQDPSDFVSAVFAAGNNTLTLGSDIGGIVNESTGSVTGDNLNVNFCQFVSDVCMDSYVTIGYAGVELHSDDTTPLLNGSGITAVSTLPNSDVINLSFASSPEGPNLEMIDGAWFGVNLPGENEQGIPFGPNNSVLIAQIAVPQGGTLLYQINVQVIDEATGPDTLLYVWDETNLDDGEIDGSCLGLNSLATDCGSGCTDTTACNYCWSCSTDDGSCAYLDACGVCGGGATAMGCTESFACNYNSEAGCDDGSCIYPACVDPLACNYDSMACAGGFCIYPDGCTNPYASNYDPFAECDDGSCTCNGDETITIYMDGGCMANAIWQVEDEVGAILNTGDFHDGFGICQDQNEICLGIGCYYINVFGDSLEGEQFIVTTDNGPYVGFTGEEEFVFFEVGEACGLGCVDVTACNYDSSADTNYGCDYSCIGCTNPLACNYEPDNTQDDGTCLLLYGCTDPNADNFDSTIECADESCEYTLSGHVFYDENANGLWDGLEAGLPYQEVTIAPGNITVYTDDNGFWSFSGLPSEEHWILAAINPSFPNLTTPSPLVLTPGMSEADGHIIGLSDQEPVYGFCVDFYPSWVTSYPCDLNIVHNICFRNMGNSPMSGIVEVEYDPLFLGYQEITPIDSAVGNTVYMSFTDIMPGQMFFYDVGLHTPTADYLGEILTSTAGVYGLEGELIFAFGESELSMELTCAYDPNDKQVFPPGYAEPHFILPETELEYLVRFQNTGNAPATTVLIEDTLDENLNLETFTLMANSHSVLTTLDHNTRVLSFLFENIMLPDSTCCEEDSHGLVAYTISPYADLPVETEINNTAHIFFDNNEAIVTNTTWNTIYECTDELATIYLELSDVCLGEEVSFSNNQMYVENYEWSWGGNAVGGNPGLFTPDETGTILLWHMASNPLCQTQNTVNVEVHDSPEAIISEDGDELSASNGTLYQWYLNGEEIIGATAQNLMPANPGDYTVLVTNEWGCSSLSDAWSVIGTSLDEFSSRQVAIFPNPASENVTISWKDGSVNSISIVDVLGQRVMHFGVANSHSITTDLSTLPAGTYMVRLHNAETTWSKKLIVE